VFFAVVIEAFVVARQASRNPWPVEHRRKPVAVYSPEWLLTSPMLPLGAALYPDKEY